MKVYTLEKEDYVEQPLEKVFAFFAKPENLQTLTPDSLHFKILTPTPIKMQLGLEIDYRIKLMGFPMRWTSKISLYEPPHRFIDEQIRGPYSYWQHLHEFSSQGSGTILRDKVRYSLPFGALGGICHRLFVRRQLEFIFKFRQAQIQKLWK